MDWKIVYLLALMLLYVQVEGEKSVVVDVYPGFGWDHLRFMDMSPIFDVSNFNISNKFQSCIEVIPVRRTRVELGSTVIDMFDSRTQDYSSNLFISGGGGFGKFKASGSYSNEYQTAKKQQGQEKTITLRNQIDYTMYDVLLTSACQLNPQVKKDIIEIAEYEASDESTMATYAAQLFVKTYGTHFVSRLSLGGSIMQDDFVKESSYYESTSEKRSYRAEAEASFLGTFGVSAKYVSTSTSSATNEVKESFVRKIVSCKGGKLSLANSSIESWESSIDALPVIVRRAIENITSFIHSDKIPELSEIELFRVREKINEAVETYIQMNVYSGCMNRSSSSFNWIANVEDGACKQSEENSQFGGFIRTCTEHSRLNQKCHGYKMLNYYTQSEQCPAKFKKYLLYQSIQQENYFRRQCRSCGFLGWKRCCRDVVDGIGERILNFYGCNKDGNHLRSAGGVLKIVKEYVFGGSFTKEKVNPITGTAACPTEQFKQLSIPGADLTICLSEYVRDAEELPHYGGIYSCSQGNIALNASKHECLQGYSVYAMGAIEDGCVLFVCLKFDKFPDIRELPSIALPPFFSIPLRNQSKSLSNNPDSDVTDAATATSSGSKIFAIVLVAILLIHNKCSEDNQTD